MPPTRPRTSACWCDCGRRRAFDARAATCARQCSLSGDRRTSRVRSRVVPMRIRTRRVPQRAPASGLIAGPCVSVTGGARWQGRAQPDARAGRSPARPSQPVEVRQAGTTPRRSRSSSGSVAPPSTEPSSGNAQQRSPTSCRRRHESDPSEPGVPASDTQAGRRRSESLNRAGTSIGVPLRTKPTVVSSFLSCRRSSFSLRGRSGCRASTLHASDTDVAYGRCDSWR